MSVVCEDDVTSRKGCKRKFLVAESDVVEDHVCEICSTKCKSYRALRLHLRCNHNIRCEVDAFVNDETECPVCCVDFRSRIRLVQHLGAHKPCNVSFLANLPPKVDEVALALLHIADAFERKRVCKGYQRCEAPSKPCGTRRDARAKKATRAQFQSVSRPVRDARM